MKQLIEIKPGVLCFIVGAAVPENNGRIVKILAPVPAGLKLYVGTADGKTIVTRALPAPGWLFEVATSQPLVVRNVKQHHEKHLVRTHVMLPSQLKPILGDDVDTEVDTVSTKTVTQGE